MCVCVCVCVRVGQAFGGGGARVATPSELESEVTKALVAAKPCLIDVAIDPASGVESARMNEHNFASSKL